MIIIKTDNEIELMKEACKVVALTHKEIEENIKPGMTTWELDLLVEKTMESLGAISAEKNYPSPYDDVQNFPGAACISINDEVIHGIPSKKRTIKEGDIVSIDLVALKNGFHGDAARTYIVGKTSKEAERLVKVTKQAFFEGIKYAKKGNRVGDISHAIGEFIEKNGYSVVREFQGHGIGRQMHEDPGIPNYGNTVSHRPPQHKHRGIRIEKFLQLGCERFSLGNVFGMDHGFIQRIIGIISI